MTLYRYNVDTPFYDSAYYNDKLKPLEYSLSRSLDSAYNSKLYKVHLFIKHDKDTVPQGLRDFYINSVDFAIEPATNMAALQGLLDRFIQKENHFK